MSLSDRGPNGEDWFAPDAARTALRLRERQAVAMTDLFLPADGRLRDDDRATIARLLAGIVDGVERELRERLGTAFTDRPMLAETLLSRRVAIASPILERTGGLRDAALVRALARRSEAGRLAGAIDHARERSRELDPQTGASPIERLVDDREPAIAAAARRLIEAERRRWGISGTPILAGPELPAETYHRLVWRVAAALRSYVTESGAVAPVYADPAIARAAAALLSGYDEGDTLPALALDLARVLAAARRLDDDLIADALEAGHVGFAVAALAIQAGIDWDVAWDIAIDPERLLLLCRAAGVSRAVAAALALHLATDGDDEALADRLDRYDMLTPPHAAAGIALWRLDPAYLDSIAALAGEAVR